MTATPKASKKSELTREAIIESARLAFAAHGYDHVGVREIGAMAGVDAAMVNRYFGSKLGLFQCVLADDADYSSLYAVSPHQLGERLAHFVVWGSIDLPQGKPLTIDTQQLVIFSRSVGSPEALPALQEALASKMTGPLSAALPEPYAREKAALIISHIFGFILVHRTLGAACALHADSQVVAKQLALSLQCIIDYTKEKDS